MTYAYWSWLKFTTKKRNSCRYIFNKLRRLKHKKPPTHPNINYNYDPPRHYVCMKRRPMPNKFSIGGSKK